MRLPLRFLCLILGIGFFLTACDDNPSVGGNLIDEQANPSQRYALLADAVTRNVDYKDVAGLRKTILVGKVQEVGTLAGVTTEATGYMDFGGSPTIPDRFKNGTISEAYVKLHYKKDAIYGDTTQTMNLEFREMTAAFNVIGGARYDSLLTNVSTTVLASANHRPQRRDTVITVPLPTTWISTHSDKLKDATKFSEQLFGFALDSNGGNAIIGINEAVSKIYIVGGDATGRDTVSFGMVAYHSFSKQTGTATGLGTDKLLVQDNTGASYNPSFNFSFAALQNVAVGNATLKIFADSTLMKSSGNFHRTPLRNLSLYGISTESGATDPVLIATTSLKDGAYSFSNPTFSRAIQRNLSGKAVFSRYFVTPSTSPRDAIQDINGNSVYPAVLYNQNAPADKKPQLLIIYSPTQ